MFSHVHRSNRLASTARKRAAATTSSPRMVAEPPVGNVPPVSEAMSIEVAAAATDTTDQEFTHFHSVTRIPRTRQWAYKTAATSPAAPRGNSNAAANGHADRPLLRRLVCDGPPSARRP